MKSLLILLAMCALAAGFVPRERRAMDPEEQTAPTSTTITTPKPKAICAPQTPCGWTTYKTLNKIIETTVFNTYCICGTGLDCLRNEDDSSISAYIHRCRLPSEDEDES